MFAAEEMTNLVNLIKLSPPDLMVVSMEGMKFPTWRLLLAMHSPLLANLMQTLRPSDEGLLAVTLPLPYPSVSSMLASLSEGGNLDHLGEAAQLLIGNNSSAPSQVTTKEGNPKNIQTMAEIPVFVDKVSHKMLSSTFVSTKAEVEERNQGGLHKADSTDELIDDQHSLVSADTSLVQNTMLEISSKESKIDLGEYSDASQTFSRNNVFDKSAKDTKSESSSFGEITDEDKTNNHCSTEENLEEVSIDIIYMKTDDVDSTKPIQEGLKAPWPGPGSLSVGLIFPNYDSMTTSLDEWSQANFSPMTKVSSGAGGFGQGKPFHTFRCPHKKGGRQRSSLGLRRRKANVIEYVDCPFLIDTKVNADGSCIVTRAITEHSGHPVSEEQFQIYRR